MRNFFDSRMTSMNRTAMTSTNPPMRTENAALNFLGARLRCQVPLSQQQLFFFLELLNGVAHAVTPEICVLAVINQQRL